MNPVKTGKHLSNVMKTIVKAITLLAIIGITATSASALPIKMSQRSGTPKAYQSLAPAIASQKAAKTKLWQTRPQKPNKPTNLRQKQRKLTKNALLAAISSFHGANARTQLKPVNQSNPVRITRLAQTTSAQSFSTQQQSQIPQVSDSGTTFALLGFAALGIFAIRRRVS